VPSENVSLGLGGCLQFLNASFYVTSQVLTVSLHSCYILSLDVHTYKSCFPRPLSFTQWKEIFNILGKTSSGNVSSTHEIHVELSAFMCRIEIVNHLQFILICVHTTLLLCKNISLKVNPEKGNEQCCELLLCCILSYYYIRRNDMLDKPN